VQLFLTGILTWALLAQAAESQPQPKDGASVSASAAKTSFDEEFKQLEADDDAAQAEVDKWKQDNTEARANGGGISEDELEKKIRAKVEPIHKAYQNFLKQHPEHAGAHLAYGCFLNERQDETGARLEWEKALELDPQNAAIYNNLAGSYSESGPAKKAFDYFNKAIELKPTEAAYYHNFGTTLYVMRKSGMTYYGIDEQQMFAKVIELYSNAVRLDPHNLNFAADLAQTYYAIKPLPIEAALGAWTNALHAARSETEREDVYVHLARVKMLGGSLAESRALLTLVTNESDALSKANLLRAINARETSPDAATVPTSVGEKRQ
jgi:tetratricopeptide (TPR) repeat protein